MSKKSNRIIGLVFLVLMLFSVMAAASATCNVIVITDPSGEDPNGAAAGSMSFANNMFQSSFIMSKNDGYAMLSGGEGNGTERNYAIIDALGAMQHGSSPAAAAALHHLCASFRSPRYKIIRYSIGQKRAFRQGERRYSCANAVLTSAAARAYNKMEEV